MRVAQMTFIVVLAASLFAVSCSRKRNTITGPSDQNNPSDTTHSDTMHTDTTHLDFTLQLLNGDTLNMRTLRGNVVLINFWAEWCIPCKEELPDIERLYENYHGAGLEVVGVVTYSQHISGALSIIANDGIRYRNGLWSDSLRRLFSLSGLPTTFVISRDGYVRARHAGGMSYQEFVNLIRPYM